MLTGASLEYNLKLYNLKPLTEKKKKTTNFKVSQSYLAAIETVFDGVLVAALNIEIKGGHLSVDL